MCGLPLCGTGDDGENNTNANDGGRRDGLVGSGSIGFFGSCSYTGGNSSGSCSLGYSGSGGL